MTTATIVSTPLPPPDSKVSGLRIALDGGAMAELLARHLPDCARGELEMLACNPRYIRYKPGTTCLVQYELTLGDEHSGRLRTLAHARLYADDEAEARWASRSLRRLRDQARQLPGPPADRAALLPELKALVELYPVDHRMPGLLGAASLTTVPPSAPVTAVELVRYKPGRKAILRFRLGREPIHAMYGRVHSDGMGSALLKAGRAFVAAGVSTPAPLGYVPDLGLLFVDEASGMRLADLRGSALFEQWLRPVAEALAHLHGAPVLGLPPVVKRNKEGSVLSAARMLAALCPKVGDRVLRLGATLAARLGESAIRSVPVHGDFYDDQVLVSNAGVVLLDLDAAGMGNPMLDVGAFLAQLSARHDESARAVFLDAYVHASGQTFDDLPTFEAAALLRIAVKPFRQLETDWPNEVEHRIELAAARLSQARASHRSVPSVVDVRIPQLALLQDRAAVGRELEQLLHEGPVEVVQASVVRHKPGRRCLLRYEIRVRSDVAAQDELLYGKVFASRRGALVYERLRAVSSAAACGPDVAIPEPVGYVAALKLLVERAVPGTPARASLLAGEEAIARRIAEAVHTLHMSGVHFDRRHGLHDEVASLHERVERVAASSESLADQARRCLELVNRLAEGQWPWRWRPVHRDFYHDQVLVGEHGLSMLDFDDAAMSEPALDVANFLAHLRLLGFQEESDVLARSASAFASRYRELDPDLDPDLVRFLEGATLLRLSDIHLPRHRGQRLAEQLLRHSELLLEI